MKQNILRTLIRTRGSKVGRISMRDIASITGVKEQNISEILLGKRGMSDLMFDKLYNACKLIVNNDIKFIEKSDIELSNIPLNS